MPYQTNLLGDFWTSYRQRRATGGRPLTSPEMRGLLSPMLQADAAKAIAAGDREQRYALANRQLNMQEEAMKRQERAATISGIAQLPLTYGVAKQTGLISPGFELLKPSTWGGGGAGGAANAGAAAGGAANLVGGQAVTTAGNPILATEAFGGAALEGGAGLGAGLGPGLLGGAAGYGASKILGANEDISQGLTYGGAGAAAGFAIGGPVGAAIGGLIGIGVSFLDDIF